jgi:hypothetical protein
LRKEFTRPGHFLVSCITHTLLPVLQPFFNLQLFIFLDESKWTVHLTDSLISNHVSDKLTAEVSQQVVNPAMYIGQSEPRATSAPANDSIAAEPQ